MALPGLAPRYLSWMTLTDDQKVQIFCAAFSAHIQAKKLADLDGKNAGTLHPADAAIKDASYAIANLQGKEWA